MSLSILDFLVEELLQDSDFDSDNGYKTRRSNAINICKEKLINSCQLDSYNDIIKLSSKIIEKGKLEFKVLEFLSELKNIKLDDSSDGDKKTSTIEIVKAGKFKHPSYGTLKFDEEKFNKFIDNFKSNTVGTDISFDAEHKPEKGAVAWLKDLFISHREIDGVDTAILNATVEWTNWGEELIDDDLYKYFSIEFKENFIDSETGESHGPTLLGGAITNRPFIKKLAPISLSEISDGISQFDNDVVFKEIDFNNELFDFFEDPFNSMSFRIRGMTATKDGHVHTFVADIKGQTVIGLTTATNEGDSHQHEIDTMLNDLITGNSDGEDGGHFHKISIQQAQLSEYLNGMELNKNSSDEEEEKVKKKNEKDIEASTHSGKNNNKKKQSSSLNKENGSMSQKDKDKLKEEEEKAKLEEEKKNKLKEEEEKAKLEEEKKNKLKEEEEDNINLSENNKKKIEEANKLLAEVPKLMELVDKQTKTIEQLQECNNKIQEEKDELANEGFCKSLSEKGIPLSVVKEVKVILNAKVNNSGNFVLTETYEENKEEKTREIEIGLKDAIKRILDAIPTDMRVDYSESTFSENNRELGGEDGGVDMIYMRNKVLEYAGVEGDDK